MLEVETIVGFIGRFLIKVQYSLRFQIGGTGLRIGMGSKGLMNHLEVKFLYAWARLIPRLENSQQAFFVKLW